MLERRRGRSRIGKVTYLALFLLGTAGAATPSSQELSAQQASKTHSSRLKPPGKVFLFRIGRKNDCLVLSGVTAQERYLGPLTGEEESIFITKQTHTKLFSCTEVLPSISHHVSLLTAQIKVKDVFS